MTITAANTDTALDVGTLGGTFWTAAKADGTYGPIATAAYDTIVKIVAEAIALDEIGGTIEQYDRNDGQKYDYFKYTSAAATGGAKTETLTVTGLAVGDTLMNVTPNTAGADVKNCVQTYTSTASAGGAGATPTVVVTGLAATDTILGVSQSTMGANSLPLLGYNTPGANSLVLVYSAEPGAGAIVAVTVLRTKEAAITATGAIGANSLSVTWDTDPGAGAKVDVIVRRTSTAASASYGMSVSGKLPIITLVSGGAPTTNFLEMQWELADNKNGFFADFGN
jgi:hypothetical protein